MRNKVFIDCGFYQGGILKYYRDWGIVDKFWEIYAFEPNPELDTDKAVEQLDLPITVIRKAVWISDGSLTLSTDKRDDAASLSGTTNHSVVKTYDVGCVDFSHFIASLPVVDVCSMDIEGAEFMVLGKLLEDGTINKIKLLDIEFHHRFMKGWLLEDVKNLLDRIKQCDVKIRLKVPLE